MELGVMISIYEETDIPAAFGYATTAGFRRGQVTSFIHGITAEEVRQMGVAARDAGFQVDAVGCYINPLRPDDSSLHGVDGRDWRTLAENMGMMNGVERIVSWSGTLGKTLTSPNLLNAEEETFNNLFIVLSGMREQVRGLPVQILLEPFIAHVLENAAACVRLARRFPGGEVKVVLDAPNLLTERGFAAQKALIPDLVARMASAIGLVHLKDFQITEDSRRVFLPPGGGALDFGMQLRAIAQFLPEVPLVIENVTTIDEMRAAREFVQGVLKDCGL
jgi:sugar phosphate isomerase/epimerase